MAMWKVSDWAVEGAQIVQIVEMEGANVVGLTTGFINRSSNSFNGTLFPLTKENKVAAESADGYMMTLHREEGSALFNWPELSSAFRLFAFRLCAAEFTNRAAIYREMADFYRAVCEKRDEVRRIVVGGVRLFGR